MQIKSLLIIIILFYASLSLAQKNASLRTRMMAIQTESYIYDSNKNKRTNYLLPKKIVEKYAIKMIDNKYVAGALIQVNQSKLVDAALKSLGVIINTKIGNIWSVTIPIENLKELISLPGIEYIELGYKLKQCLDNATRDTRVNLVNDGFQLPMPYNGQGVIVGVVDGGFDYTHPMFKDATGNSLRISRVWDHGDNTGIAPVNFNYGRELVGETEIVNAATDEIYNSHGTHVTGIAAGSGFGSNNMFKGVASESEIVQVALDFNNFNSTSITDGFAYICNYANSVNKPAVVNMSLAANGGSNDGTTLFERSIENLISDRHILVAAAGNNFDNYKLHIEKNSTPTYDTLKTIFQIIHGEAAEIWGDVNATLRLSVSIYDFNGAKLIETPLYYSSNNPTINLNYPVNNNNDTVSLSIIGQHLSVLNNKSSFYVEVSSKNFNSYHCMISASSDFGNIHMWNLSESDFYNSINGNVIPNTKNGDENYAIFPPGTVSKAITVGAYTTKNTCTYLSGATSPITYFSDSATIAPFSKKGPCLGGYMKPEITAPGNVIVSAVNKFDSYYSDSTNSVFMNNNWYYAPMHGTSMATPMVSGIIALMYQANPSLTRNEIVNIIKQSARQDNFTGFISNSGDPQWGWGKIDAYNAVQQALTTGLNQHELQNDFLMYPNPASDKLVIYNKTNYLKEAVVTIYNITGQEVKTEKIKGQNYLEINTTNFSKGVYIIKIQVENKIENRKLIIQ